MGSLYITTSEEVCTAQCKSCHSTFEALPSYALYVTTAVFLCGLWLFFTNVAPAEALELEEAISKSLLQKQ